MPCLPSSGVQGKLKPLLYLSLFILVTLQDEPRHKCVQVPKIDCQELNSEACQEIPVRDCQQKARRYCSLVPKIHTKEVTERQCKTVNSRVCNQVPKQVSFAFILYLLGQFLQLLTLQLICHHQHWAKEFSTNS